MKHIIKQQRIAVSMAEQKMAPEVQDELSYAYQRKVIPDLSRLFDELAPEQHVISIDQIEVDIGAVRVDHLREEFADRVIRALREAVREKVYQADHADLPSVFGSENQRTVSKKTSLLSVFSYYLKFGNWPWQHTEKRSFQELFEVLIKEDPENLLVVLRKELLNEQSVQRIVYQLDEKRIVSLLRLLTGEHKVVAEAAILDLINACTKAAEGVNLKRSGGHLEDELWKTVLRWSINSSINLTSIDALHELVLAADQALQKLDMGEIVLPQMEGTSVPVRVYQLIKTAEQVGYSIQSKALKEWLKVQAKAVDYHLKNATEGDPEAGTTQPSKPDQDLRSSEDTLSEFKKSEDSQQESLSSFTDVEAGKPSQDLREERVEDSISGEEMMTSSEKSSKDDETDDQLAGPDQQHQDTELATFGNDQTSFEANQESTLSKAERETKTSERADQRASQDQELKKAQRSRQFESSDEVETGTARSEHKSTQEASADQDDQKRIDPSKSAEKSVSGADVTDNKDVVRNDDEDEKALLEGGHEPLGQKGARQKDDEGTQIEKTDLTKRSDRSQKVADAKPVSDQITEQNFGTTASGKSDESVSFPDLPSESFRDKWKAPEFQHPQRLEEAFINNAGLVLLWPYFTTLFKGMGWMTDGAFNAEEDQFRAVHFLQHLVLGDTAYQEAELTLNKLLCGLRAEDAIPASVEFTDEELEEATNLLEVVIQNWTVLKGTSVEGFRETFLQKEGILKKDFSGWKLYVERTSIDILLERIPWSYSIIKLPWLDQMIYVEW